MRKPPLKCFEVPIIAGTFKGKRICIPQIDTTRSSKSILRESLFNTLQNDLYDTRFVEVFAGSGSVGLEALSRGVDHVWFLERNRDVYALLKENIARLDPTKATAILTDSFEAFPALQEQLATEGTPTVFYFDPPFSIREGMETIYDRTLALIEGIDPRIVRYVIIEHMSTLTLPESIGTLERIRQKRFGKSTLSYFSST